MSYTQVLSELLLPKIEDLLKVLGVQDYRKTERYILGPCPCHENSDSSAALNILIDNKYPVIVWKCHTRFCHDIYGKSIYGFIRGIIHRKTGSEITYWDAVEFVSDFLNNPEISYSQNVPYKKDIFSRIHTISKTTHNILCSRKYFKSIIKSPPKFYLDRGYSDSILLEYDVGLCTKSGNFLDRIVTPILDDSTENVIGVLGRSTHPKCLFCKKHHDLGIDCSANKTVGVPKWLNSTGLDKSKLLYNLWNAKENILSESSVVVVESPGNCWKLVQHGIKNVVAILGSHMSEYQTELLCNSGALRLILMFDCDEAGTKCGQQVLHKYNKLFTIVFPSIDYGPYNDVADIPNNEFYDRVISKI